MESQKAELMTYCVIFKELKSSVWGALLAGIFMHDRLSVNLERGTIIIGIIEYDG